MAAQAASKIHCASEQSCVSCLCCNPAAPGLVTNLTAYAQNHSYVVVTWYLPQRINGLITKFAVKTKNVRWPENVRIMEVNAEEIMTVALPHCNVLSPAVILCYYNIRTSRVIDATLCPVGFFLCPGRG